MSRFLKASGAIFVAGLGSLAAGSADAQENALGQFLAQREALAAIVAECGRRDPDGGPLLDARFGEWKKAHADQLDAVDAAMQQMPEDKQEAVEAALKPMREVLSTNLDVAAKDGGTRKGCEDAFAAFSADLPTGRYDAENLGEAEGMYQVTMLQEARLGPWCLQNAPEMREQIESSQAQWRRQEAGIQQLARTAMAEATKQEPAAVEKVIKQTNTQVDAVFAAIEKQGPEGISAYCRKEYAALVGGGKRTQTPKMYQLLDEAVEAGKK